MKQLDWRHGVDGLLFVARGGMVLIIKLMRKEENRIISRED